MGLDNPDRVLLEMCGNHLNDMTLTGTQLATQYATEIHQS